MQVEVHDIKAEVAGTNDPKQGVEVGAIAINQTAGFVHQADHFDDIFIKEAQRVGISQHQAGQGLIAFSFECFQVHVAAFIRGQGNHIESTHRGGGRVGAVGGIGDQDLVRSGDLLTWWYFLMIIAPTSSPCAPAEGWMVTLWRPLSSCSHSCSWYIR